MAHQIHGNVLPDKGTGSRAVPPRTVAFRRAEGRRRGCPVAAESGPGWPVSIEGDLIADFYGPDMEAINDGFSVALSSAGTVRETGVEIVAFEVR